MTSLTGFKNDFLESVLQFLWGQWSQLGVYGAIAGEDNKVIDPEALLLSTLDFGRYDPRLFDEVVDWLLVNEKFINIRRLRSLLPEYPDFPYSVLAAVCEVVRNHSKPLKWDPILKYLKKHISKREEYLFHFKDGMEIPVSGAQDPIFYRFGLIRNSLELRHMSSEVPIEHIPNLVFKLRSFFGVSSRAEIFAYLLTHDEAYPRKIAREVYYSQKGIAEALQEMAVSGLIKSRMDGREKLHRLGDRDQWLKVFGLGDLKTLSWVNWPLVFKALSVILREISHPGIDSESTYIQSSELRALMRDVRRNLEASGIPFNLSDDKAYPGETYLKRFFSDIETVTEGIGFKLPDGREIPKRAWDTLRPMEKEMTRKHPYHIADVEVIIQSLEDKLGDDGDLLAKYTLNSRRIENIKRSSIHMLIWRVLRTLKSVVYLCMDDLSQSAFPLCRQILEEYTDLHQLSKSDGNVDHRTLGFYIGIYREIIEGVKALLTEYRGTKIVEPELKKDKRNLERDIEEILAALSSPEDHNAIKGEWRTKVFKRLKHAGLWNEFGLIYQYLSIKTHCSFFDVLSRTKLPNSGLILPELKLHKLELVIEEDVTEEVIGFAYEIVYRAMKDYFAFMGHDAKYIFPVNLISGMDRIYEFVNQRSFRLYAKKDLNAMKIYGVNLLM